MIAWGLLFAIVLLGAILWRVEEALAELRTFRQAFEQARLERTQDTDW